MFIVPYIKKLLSGLPPKWHNFLVRVFSASILISALAAITYMGPLPLVLMILAFQTVCFHEIIHIGYEVYKSHHLPWFRSLSWFLLLTSNYFFCGESLIDHFRILLAKEDLFQTLVTHHRFISFCLYCCGVMGFVLSLVKKHYVQQFTLFGWTHVTLLMIVAQSNCMIRNIFNGSVWFVVPSAVMTCNDTFAYFCGFFFGRTPLIKLSPNKTWEGFIGGGLFTVLFAGLFSLVMLQFDHLVCPIDFDSTNGTLSMKCVRNVLFQPVLMDVPMWIFPPGQLPWYPFVGHSLIIGVFCSIVGPFGGFFASGFKRAFRIKDFSDIIPGHGGLVDRFDCQFLVGTFVLVYYQSFIRYPSVTSLLDQVSVFSTNQQLEFYRLFENHLIRHGLLNMTSVVV